MARSPPFLSLSGGQAEAQYRNGTLGRLTEAMTAWMDGVRLERTEFAERFFGRSADDSIVQKLHGAALDASLATNHADLAEAAGKVAEAMRSVGLDTWPRFVADAQARARDPATVEAVEKSGHVPNSGRDAIRPVYPIETALGIAAAGVAGGAAAARAAGAAILRQVLGDSRPTGIRATSSEQQAEPGLPRPLAPEDLLTQGWNETSHPEAAKMGHRTLRDPKTGEVMHFDEGRPGEPGFEGQDHYHRLNPDRTSKQDEYLDVDGNPVARGSDASHILPRKDP